jgi:hypothetical protein
LDAAGAHFSWALDSSGAQIGLGFWQLGLDLCSKQFGILGLEQLNLEAQYRFYFFFAVYSPWLNFLLTEPLTFQLAFFFSHWLPVASLFCSFFLVLFLSLLKAAEERDAEELWATRQLD